ncbi:MAG TPA: LuxR C-terminal-related transcriptional regulator [Streptosporangiaceae bacterium]|nr:LuxR C-terminal-related transcriptional regulator [Streptosporangiaceae bacterium]
MVIDQARNSFEEPNSFVGRERELDELRRFVPSTRAVTLCGPGGIGKTRLALRVLAELADEFPDGVWFIELGELRQPDLVVSRVASVIGVDEEPGRPLLETLADALRPRRLLLALDTCEHLIDSCARMCHRLLASSQGLHVLATSREPLRMAAEAVWQVPPLSLPEPGVPQAPEELGRYEAVRLFGERAEASLPGFALGAGNVSAVSTLCRSLDGVPLAIELAAAWVRVLSVEQIVARLDDRFRLLTSGDRTAPARQRTLRAAIDWSHDLLAGPEQVMLRRLSVFAGWSLEMAEQVCSSDDLPAAGILDLLAALADKSLVVVENGASGQTRYRMLDTIREYAAARLDAAGEAAALQQRLRDYAMHETEHLMQVGMGLIPASWPVTVQTFRRFDSDLGNLRQVLGRCLADREAEVGLRLCTSMGPVWIVRGSFAEGAEWFDSFLGLASPAVPVPAAVRGPAMVGRAQLALAADPVGAEARAAEGLELCREAGADFWTATALNLLTEVALHAGRGGEAADRAGETLAAARQAGDRWNEGYALGTMAAIAGQRGDLAGAQRLGEAALAIMRGIDQQWGVARTLLGLGDLARLTGDAHGARRRYEEALAILREVNARPEMARCLAGLGRIALDQGEIALGRRHLTQSIELSRSIGSRIGTIRGVEAFAALALAEGQPERAVRLAAAAAALRAAAHLPPRPDSWTDRYLAGARHLGESAVRRLWEQGSGLDASAAVGLALDGAPQPEARGAGGADTAPAGKLAAPGGLTPRELEIAALIARGQSNKAIGEELVISPATAARHVANIMLKLEFSSRSQIAAWAVRESGGAAADGPGPGEAGGQAR